MEKERIELHCHTHFSSMDGVQSVKAIVEFAIDHGMKAIAFTDHENIYAYPEIMNCVYKKDIKPIYGIEASVVDDITNPTDDIEDIKNRTFSHFTILIKDEAGRKNLYKLLTDANTIYFNDIPRIPLSRLLNNREGLLIGSACSVGLLGEAIMNNEPEDRLLEISRYYDYLEVQPVSAGLWMIYNHLFPSIKSKEDIIAYNDRIISLGEKCNIPVVATSDAHYVYPENKQSRDVVLYADGYWIKQYDDCLNIKTTTEMLEEFSYLGEKKSKEIVIDNTHLVAEQIDMITPISNIANSCERKGDFEKLKALCDSQFHKKYGDNDITTEKAKVRLAEELGCIEKYGTSHMYLYFYELIHKNKLLPTQYSLRGSAACMLVSYLLEISHVNPLDKDTPLYMEFFVDISGNKLPDIDMNFDPEIWPSIIESTKLLPGLRTAYKASYYNRAYDDCVDDWIYDYEEYKELDLSEEEKNKVKSDINGIFYCKELHPGGMLLIPERVNPVDFSPLEYIRGSEEEIFHFDYHSLDVNFEKIDLLQHENCLFNTRMYRTTNVYPTIEDLKSKDLLSLLTSSDGIGVKNGLNHGILSGVLGVPGLSNAYMINLIQVLKPNSFEELVKIEGICHGTGTWFDNGERIIAEGGTLKDIISTREDVYEIMISHGIERKTAFHIAESVRKGLFSRGKMKEELVCELHSHNIPERIINSLEKIKYLFPRAHAAEYAYMEICSLFYKYNYPELFYDEYFKLYGNDFLMKIKNGFYSLESLSYEFKVDESAQLKDMKHYLVWNEMRLRNIELMDGTV